ncbi:MAG: HupE/UreJ family protein [Gammaproteobacteria bacterium]|nr:HupE/UreJ family protein [Gammaproteobacteria bacterium]
MNTATRFTPNRCALPAILGLSALAPAAFAHHPMGGATPETFTQGLLSGFGHPIIGIDHFAFLVVVALLSVTLSGRARYLVPAAFVVATVAGTLYHLGAADLPLTETVIALSVFGGGLAVLLKGSASALALAVLTGIAGVFHGYAYGESIIGAEATPLLSYLVGFSLIQYAIIVSGIKLVELIARRSEKLHGLAVRLGGLSTAAVGAVFLGLSLT